MSTFSVEVRYRTKSACKTKTLRVEADDSHQANQIATDKVRNSRGVIRIDGGHAVQVQK